jgi:hypothetical protein
VNAIPYLIELASAMPPPPSSGSGGDTSWWRIGGVLLVTAVTIGIFTWIFRPVAIHRYAEIDDHLHDEVVPDPVSGEGGGTLVPFRERSALHSVTPDEFTAAAASERLRRITGVTEPPPPMPHGERRRLGSRRSWTSGNEPGRMGNQATPADNLAEATDAQAQPGNQSEPAAASTYERDQETVTTPQTAESTLPRPWEIVGHSPDPDHDNVDLLGELVNRLPSAVDNRYAPSGKGPVPTEGDLERMATSRPVGKILPFAPRPTRASSESLDETYQLLEQFGSEHERPTEGGVITLMPVDAATREAITGTVQELLFCANVGEFMHGFSLYTDRYLFQFMTESGLTEETFKETFSAIPAREPVDWTRIDRIDDLHWEPDGRLVGNVRYIERDQISGTEQFTFKLDQITQRWLIDGIRAI